LIFTKKKKKNEKKKRKRKEERKENAVGMEIERNGGKKRIRDKKKRRDIQCILARSCTIHTTITSVSVSSGNVPAGKLISTKCQRGNKRERKILF